VRFIRWLGDFPDPMSSRNWPAVAEHEVPQTEVIFRVVHLT
jgi:hypothetical protein